MRNKLSIKDMFPFVICFGDGLSECRNIRIYAELCKKCGHEDAVSRGGLCLNCYSKELVSKIKEESDE
jgi:hypothetical protein